MSLLMFQHAADDGFLIVTDTLATTLDGNPFLFQNKTWPLPHMSMVIGGTGLAPFIEHWVRIVQTEMRALDIEMLDRFTPDVLKETWAAQEAAFDGQIPTATIYHFGIAEAGGRPVRFTYRSTNDFNSERTDESGFGIKPTPQSFDLAAPGPEDEWIDLARRVRAEQDALPQEDRIYIGGDLVRTVVTGSGIAVQRIHRFEDFGEMWNRMNEIDTADGTTDSVV